MTKCHLQSEDDFNLQKAKHALPYIDASDRDTCFRVGAALKNEFGEQAYKEWDKWLQTTTKDNYDADAMLDMWDSIKEDGRTTLGTLFYFAQKNPDYKPLKLSKEAKFDKVKWAKDKIEIIESGVQTTGVPLTEYFEHRGLSGDIPESIRFHPGIDYYEDKKKIGTFSCIVARVVDSDNNQTAVHTIYLNEDGTKADVGVVKKTIGSQSGSKVIIGNNNSDTTLYITEGIETGSAIHRVTDGTVWCSLVANNLVKQVIPEHIQTVYIMADKDLSETGQKAAYDTAQKLTTERPELSVYIVTPENDIPENSKSIDWLDIYTDEGSQSITNAINNAQEHVFNPNDIGLEARLLRDIAYLSDPDMFYDTKESSSYKVQALNRTYAHELREPSASVRLLGNQNCIKARNIIFIPGNDEKLVKDNKGRDVINTWYRNQFDVIDGDPTLYLNHLKFILPDSREREHFLDYSACVVQNRDVKINHAMVLGGEPRTGKDALLEPIRHCLGPWAKDIPADRLKEHHDDWLYEAELVIFQELKNFEKYAAEIENRLKPVLAAPPHTLNIRLFGKGFFESPNVVKGIFMTNYKTSLHISEGDERYSVFWSPAKPKNKDYYKILYDWLEDDGNAIVAHYLLNRDISNFNPKAGAILTQHKKELIGDSKTALRQVIDTMMNERKEPFTQDLVKSEDIRRYLMNARHGDISAKRIGNILREMDCEHRVCRKRDISGKRIQITLWATRNKKKWKNKTDKEWVDEFDNYPELLLNKLPD